MKKHYCPICLKPYPITWCPKHGSFYSVDTRTARTTSKTLTRSEVAKLLRENRRGRFPRKPKKYRGPN